MLIITIINELKKANRLTSLFKAYQHYRRIINKAVSVNSYESRLK